MCVAHLKSSQGRGAFDGSRRGARSTPRRAGTASSVQRMPTQAASMRQKPLTWLACLVRRFPHRCNPLVYLLSSTEEGPLCSTSVLVTLVGCRARSNGLRWAYLKPRKWFVRVVCSRSCVVRLGGGFSWFGNELQLSKSFSIHSGGSRGPPGC